MCCSEDKKTEFRGKVFSRIDGYAIKYRWSNAIPQIENLEKIGEENADRPPLTQRHWNKEVESTVLS